MSDPKDVVHPFTSYLQKNLEVAAGIWPAWSEYIPWNPSGKQLAFLLLPCREAFFGGAAGGGKSVSLLMGALQYVDIPGYAALILRKNFTDLSQPGALIDLSRLWLEDTDARYDSQQHCWNFPSGAKLQFGHIGEINASQKYQGAQFQFCVAEGTLIRMYNGRLLPIEKVRRGNLVANLEGSQLVTHTFNPSTKFCV